LLPLDFLKQLIDTVKEEKPETLFVSESVHGGFCRYLRNQGIACLSESEIFQVFDMAYDYDIHPYFEGYLKGETSFKRYLEALTLQEEIYPENYIKMRNLENHDYGRFAKMVDHNLEQIKQWLALTFFSKGSTMIYAGQEYCDDHLPNLFNKDVVHWDGDDLSQYIKQLNILTNQDICAYGAYDIDINDQDVYIGRYQYQNHQMIGIFNIGLISGSVQVDLKDGRYTNDINGETIVVKNGKIPYISEPILIQL
jgi:hypothetical protein